MFKINKNSCAFSSVFIFVILVGLCSSLGLVFYTAQQSYMVALKRYEAFSTEYQLEGLLNHGINCVMRNKKNKNLTYEFPGWCSLHDKPFAGHLLISYANSICTVCAELVSSNAHHKASCILQLHEDEYEIIEYRLFA